MRLFGLIGFPLSHSFSVNYFTKKFQREHIGDALYKAFPITDISLLPDLIKCHPNLCGLNVTIPYKEKVVSLLDELDETAREVCAVNCISVTTQNSGSPKLKGHNTDVYGFRQSIKPFLASHHEKALILGTGGASKAVEHVLREIGVECIFVTREKKSLPGKMVLTYDELNVHVMNMCKLIVNCSPVGTWPEVQASCRCGSAPPHGRCRHSRRAPSSPPRPKSAAAHGRHPPWRTGCRSRRRAHGPARPDDR